MHALTGPVVVAAGLLAAAGAPKIARPVPAVGALRSVGVRVPRVAVRVFGAAETVLGLVVLLAGGRVATALVAASYAGFTGFVAVALRRGGAVSSCGCVGRADTPPTVTHLAVTGGLAVLTAAGAATGAPAGIPASLSHSPGPTVAVLVLAAVAGWFAWLALAELPRLSVARG